MAMRRVTILVAGDPVAETLHQRGGFPELIMGAGASAWSGAWSACDLRSSDELPTLAELAAVIVTGSAASVTEQLPWMQRAAAYLRELVSGDVPVLGICFGHQLLGDALGGRVARNPNGREIGTQELELFAREAVFGEGPRALVNTTHVDSVVELPPGAECFARTALEPHAAVKFAKNAWGVQYHPEVDAEVMRHYVRARRDLLAREGLDVEALESGARDTPEGAAVVARFLQRVSARELAHGPTPPGSARSAPVR
jgi:GMP synthase (glutamine-hydrolysing)